MESDKNYGSSHLAKQMQHKHTHKVLHTLLGVSYKLKLVDGTPPLLRTVA